METLRRRTAYDRAIEIVSFIALLCALIPLFFYGKMDDSNLIPIHYSITGQADRWGSPSYLLVVVSLALGFYLLLSILERYYTALNYPVRITAANAPFIYRLAIRLLRHLKLFLMLIFAYLNTLSFAIATGREIAINNYILITLLAGFLLTILYFAIQMIKHK